MENDILGERLKGLHHSIEDIAGSKFLEVFLRGEYGVITAAAHQLCEAHSEQGQLLSDLLAERDRLRYESEEIAAFREEAVREKIKLAKLAKDQTAALQNNLKQAEEDRARLKGELEMQEKKYFDLSEELTKVRVRMKQYRQKRKAYGEAEEKVCKNCQRMFTEAENFKWSCRTHRGEYSGEMWWCCGKGSRDAPGCQISAHVSKEDEEEEQTSEQKPDNSGVRCSVSHIQSCKELGHLPLECPKDPNFRSHFDLVEEQRRLCQSSTIKQKHALPSLEFSSHALQVLTNFSDMADFNHGEVASSPSSSDFNSSGEEVQAEEKDKRGFEDIHGLKARVMRKRRTFEEPKSAQILRSGSVQNSPTPRMWGKGAQTLGY